MTPRIRIVVVALALLLVVVVIGAAISGSAPSASPAAAARASMSATAAPTATPSTTASPTPASMDVDDGETAPPSAPLPTPVATTNPDAVAVGWLPGEPNPALTPGALNPAVTQATIGSTICVSGWTATIRPPSSYTTRLKIQQIAEYGYTDTSTSAYEEDHLISLELGGAPTDPRNLWPEPYTNALADGRDTGARVKDSFESSLKRQVCAGQITLAQAQAQIGIHWVHAFYGIPMN